MDKTLLFIVNPRAGKTKSSAPLFDAVATFGKAGYLVKVALTQTGFFLFFIFPCTENN